LCRSHTNVIVTAAARSSLYKIQPVVGSAGWLPGADLVGDALDEEL
jgi:hypothetical protein